MNLAIVGPLPPKRTGVADYSAALLPHLRPHFTNVVAVTEDGIVTGLAPGAVDAVYAAADVSWWRSGRSLPVYQMGCSVQYHGFVHDLLRVYPGITDLHDGNLLPFYHAMTLERGDRTGYVREVSFCLERGDGHRRAWHALRNAEPLDPMRISMLGRVVAASLGVVVHSNYMRDVVLAVRPAARVAVIPLFDMSVGQHTTVSREAARAALNIDPEDPVLGVFGFVAPSKGLDVVLRAIRQLSARFPRLQLVCVGEVVADYDVRSVVGMTDLVDRVCITGYVPLDRMQLYMSAIDIGVNLRQPTWGESSGTLARLMAIGKPVLVTDAGAFRDLPEEAVVKIPYGADEVDDVVQKLTHLLIDQELRDRIGSSAERHMRDYCAPELVAEHYAKFARAIIGGSVW